MGTTYLTPGEVLSVAECRRGPTQSPGVSCLERVKTDRCVVRHWAGFTGDMLDNARINQ
jgi:hypothetical protein